MCFIGKRLVSDFVKFSMACTMQGVLRNLVIIAIIDLEEKFKRRLFKFGAANWNSAY